MQRTLTFFLQAVIVLFGTVTLAGLLWEPHLEGRNVNATLFAIYFKGPFLAYVYIGSIPFFVALYQAIKLLGYIRQNKTFSPAAVHALRTIKYCALLTAGAIIAADVFLLIAARFHGDDPTGAVMLGMIAAAISIVSAAAVAVLERIFQTK